MKSQVLDRIRALHYGPRALAIRLPVLWADAMRFQPWSRYPYAWDTSASVVYQESPVNLCSYRDPATGDIIVDQRKGDPPTTFPGVAVHAYTPDGKQVIVSDENGALRFWDIESRTLVRSLYPDDEPPRERPPNTFRVAAVQHASEFGDPEENRRQLKVAIEIAAYQHAHIVVLPEAAVSGYLSPDLKHTWQVGDKPVSQGLIGLDPARIAETVPGTSTEFFAKLARQYGLYITVPLVEIDRKTLRYYNTVVLLDPRGEIVIHYRKLNHWPWAEKSWATEGDRGLPVVDTPYGRLGVIICYDIHQQAAKLAEQKTDTLLYCIAWVDEANSDWFDVQLPARAKQYGYNIVAANWTLAPGTPTPTWHGFGQSRIIDAQGNILTKASGIGTPEVIYADLELPQASKAKEPLGSRREVPRSEPDGRDSSGGTEPRVFRKAPDSNSGPRTSGASGDAKTLTRDLGGGVTMDRVSVEPGSFQMGVNQYWRDNESVRTVSISKPC